MKKFQVGIGKVEIQGVSVDGAREVEAEHFTIEVSGAATFWKQIIPGQSSALVLALAPGEWKTIELLSQVDT